MNEIPTLDRRTVLHGIGTVAVTGALAGCGGGGGGDSGGSDGGDGSSDGGDSGGSDGGDGSSDGGDSGGSGGDDGSGGVPGEVKEYLSDVGNYDGTLSDATGQGEVTVQVGTEANGGNFGFGPAAVRVDSGTTVVWEWTGQGGSHNVVAEGGAFESELAGDEGHTFEHTLENSGVFLYACTPHKGLGMKGAIVVE